MSKYYRIQDVIDGSVYASRYLDEETALGELFLLAYNFDINITELKVIEENEHYKA